MDLEEKIDKLYDTIALVAQLLQIQQKIEIEKLKKELEEGGHIDVTKSVGFAHYPGDALDMARTEKNEVKIIKYIKKIG